MKIRNGIFAGVLPAMLLTGCMGGLPSCGSSEAKGLVKKIVNQKSFFIGQFVSLDDVEETAANNEAGIRVCSATLTTTRISKDITYSIRWQNKENKEYIVEVNN